MSVHSSLPATVSALNKLIALAYAGLELCQRALSRRLLPDAARELSKLLEDHRRHISSLMLLVDALGGRISASLLWQSPTTPGDSASKALPEDDITFLRALAANESLAHTVYQDLLLDPALPVSVRGVAAGNLSNGRFHLSWLLERLMQLTPSGLKHNAARA